MGKRVDAEYFMESAAHGEAVEGCNYLLAVDMDMDPVPATRWRTGRAATATSTWCPTSLPFGGSRGWRATALVLSDVAWHDGSPVKPSPRQVLRAQIERAKAMGFEPMFGTELEFYLIKETFAEAHAKHYTDLTPSVPYILDYHVLATTYDEPFIRAVRKGMKEAGHQGGELQGRGVAGPAGDQLPLLRRADHGRQPRHLQERDQGDGAPAGLLRDVHGEARPHVDRNLMPRAFEPLEGRAEHVRRRVRDVQALPRRATSHVRARSPSSWRRTSTRTSDTRPHRGRRPRWRGDTTTGRADFRIVGHGQHLRTESRIPGADVNPYLASRR